MLHAMNGGGSVRDGSLRSAMNGDDGDDKFHGDHNLNLNHASTSSLPARAERELKATTQKNKRVFAYLMRAVQLEGSGFL